MGTQVLPARDYLICSNSTVFHGGRKPYTAYGATNSGRLNNNHSGRKSNIRQNLEKQTASSINKSPSAPDLTIKHQSKKQRLPLTNVKRVEFVSIENIGTRKPSGITNSPMRSDDSYAGSACFLSPSPRCLPLPSFFSTKQGSITTDHNCDDTATKDLRRLLRIE
ncbi:hypothetical protein L1887_00077 [Cichorium endivia]|nr:hypothetical protein L1887_00077 [Cichorium endivia]